MKKSNLLIEIAFTAAALKTAHASTSSPTETPTPTHPCGRVAEAWAAQYSSSPSATPTAAPSVAYECLNSIPLYKDAAIQFIDEIKPYMEYQSDIAFKRDPPSDYSYSGYDIFEELDRIRSKIRSGYYANEYEWQLDFYLSVVGKGHDYHMNIYPDLLARAVEFARPLSLVSISEDGSSLPVIKVYEDIASSIENASTVNRINEEDAALYLENLVRLTSTHQDIDAGYNTMFFEKAFLAEYGNKGYFESLGRNRYVKIITTGNSHATSEAPNWTYIGTSTLARPQT